MYRWFESITLREEKIFNVMVILFTLAAIAFVLLGIFMFTSNSNESQMRKWLFLSLGMVFGVFSSAMKNNEWGIVICSIAFIVDFVLCLVFERKCNNDEKIKLKTSQYAKDKFLKEIEHYNYLKESGIRELWQ